MLAAVYNRVSTLDQRPELPRAELRRAAAARGYRVALEVEETASGGKNDREGLQRVLEAARRGKVQAVIVWKLDRFGRSLLDLVANVRQLRAAGVRFIATSQGIDLGAERDSAAELQFNVLCAVAEYEREVIRERTRLGLEAARRRGKRLGRPSGQPARADVMRLRETGQSWKEISKRLGASVMQCRRAAAR